MRPTASLASDSLVYRYNPRASPDGVRGAEGTFSACSFWHVEALTRAGRWTRRGWRSRRCPPTPTTWACMPSRSAAPDSSRELPQALTHLALISAAFNLDRALGA